MKESAPKLTEFEKTNSSESAKEKTELIDNQSEKVNEKIRRAVENAINCVRLNVTINDEVSCLNLSLKTNERKGFYCRNEMEDEKEHSVEELQIKVHQLQLALDSKEDLLETQKKEISKQQQEILERKVSAIEKKS